MPTAIMPVQLRCSPLRSEAGMEIMESWRRGEETGRRGEERRGEERRGEERRGSSDKI